MTTNKVEECPAQFSRIVLLPNSLFLISCTIGRSDTQPVRWFALSARLDYDSRRALMGKNDLLPCDGCGQPASSEHSAKRLQRLERTTRYRPVHIATVLLGAFAPKTDAEFLYAVQGAGEFLGEAKHVLASSGVSQNGKSADMVLAEFQRAGFLLTYALECPLNPDVSDPVAIHALLQSRLPALLARVRRSLRPKRIVPISSSLEPLLGSLTDHTLGCSVVLDGGKPFAFDGVGSDQAAARLGQALTAATAPNP